MGDLTLEDRVAAQRAVERVYWSHRTWPADNRTPRPAFEASFTDDVLRQRALDVVRKSEALAELWNRPIEASEIQAEMERMARETKQPSVLRELFAALHDDPSLIAETIVRPVVADRLIRRLYASDPRLHEGVRRDAAKVLAGVRTAEGMRLARGSYHEATWRKPEIPPEQWAMLQNSLSRQVVGAVGPLLESDEAFYTIGILERTPESIRTATLAWLKEPFDTWWSSQRTQRPHEAAIDVAPSSFTPVAVAPDAGCTPDSWQPTLRTGVPGQRVSYVAVWTGTEAIFWGGYTEAGVFNTGWRYNPALDSWTAMSTVGAPAARFFHVGVWTGSRLVVWGGSGTSDFNDGGRYDPATDTWLAMSTTGAPPARASASAVWTGTLMVVWGGYSVATGYVATGGRYNPSTDAWTATATTGAPVARDSHTAIWTGTRMVVWGGSDGASYRNDGRQYDPGGNLWTTILPATNAPSPRVNHTAVWSGSRMIVWGGFDTSFVPQGTGASYNPTLNTWTAVTTTGAPEARGDHGAVWTGSRMIIWGGSGATALLQNGGRYDPTTDSWTPTSTTGAPSARSTIVPVWTGTQMIVWAGFGTNAYPVTGGRYDPATDTWTPTAAGVWAPTGRKNHLAFWTGAEMLVWGGDALLTPVGYRLYLFSGAKYNPALDVWTAITPFYNGNEGYKGVWTGSDMLVYGGDDAFGNTVTQGFRYNLVSDTWSNMSAVGMPAGRIGHSAVWSGTELIVWGGHSAVSGTPTVLADGARYDPATDTWSAMTGLGGPTARESHSAVWTGSDMIVWGGTNAGTFLSDGSRYTPSAGGGTWSPIASPALAARSGHTAVWTGSRMIVWGGLTGAGRAGDGATYDPGSDTWAPTADVSAPAARNAHTAVWTGNAMIVWGGTTGAANLDSGGSYSPSTDNWSPTATAGAPTPRAAHTAVWADTKMIVWSGSAFGQPPDDSGGLYCACVMQTWYQDLDGDGYGDPGVSTVACTPPANYAPAGGDCNDGNGSINPGAVEVCNGIDDNCDLSIDNGIPVPSGHPALDVTGTNGSTQLSWSAVSGVTGYDVVTGDLGTLRGSGGNFTASTTGCLGDDVSGTTASDTSVISPGSGVWYLVRPMNACGGSGTYDEGVPSQPASRDAGVNASGSACP